MKITGVNFVRVQGTVPAGEVMHREPLGSPLDEMGPRPRIRGVVPRVSQHPRKVDQLFLRLQTDAHLVGQIGPVSPDIAVLIETHLVKRILGVTFDDPARLWDLMYRGSPHGRSGLLLHAISIVDCAVWDLLGKAHGKPVWRLLGEAMRPVVAAYAQTKGLSHHPEHLPRQIHALVDAGWTRLKLFLNHGPCDGEAGVEANVAVVKLAKDVVGSEVQIAVDAWRCWNFDFALRMARALEPLGIAWIEEPLMPELIEDYAELRRRSPVPIAAGEHHYGRWEYQTLLMAGAVDILQPDVTWCGGLTEFQRIAANAAAVGVAVYPHTHLLAPSVHAVAAGPAAASALVEFPVFADRFDAQHFLRHPVVASKGEIKLPSAPGLGMELDQEKVESEKPWSFQ